MTNLKRCPHFDRKNRQCLRGFHLFGAHTYAPIPKVGARKLRTAVDEALFREQVRENALGYCAAIGMVKPNGGFVCGGGLHEGEHAHHLFPEDRDIGLHDPARGLWLCIKAHEFCHTNVDAAKVLGLLRPDGLSR